MDADEFSVEPTGRTRRLIAVVGCFLTLGAATIVGAISAAGNDTATHTAQVNAALCNDIPALSHDLEAGFVDDIQRDTGLLTNMAAIADGPRRAQVNAVAEMVRVDDYTDALKVLPRLSRESGC